jgi:hypothetical protein
MAAMDLQRNYEDLANAIILRAAKDYREALEKPGSLDASFLKKEVERFFLSRWFSELTKADPKKILEYIKSGVGA